MPFAVAGSVPSDADTVAGADFIAELEAAQPARIVAGFPAGPRLQRVDGR